MERWSLRRSLTEALCAAYPRTRLLHLYRLPSVRLTAGSVLLSSLHRMSTCFDHGGGPPSVRNRWSSLNPSVETWQWKFSSAGTLNKSSLFSQILLYMQTSKK